MIPASRARAVKGRAFCAWRLCAGPPPYEPMSTGPRVNQPIPARHRGSLSAIAAALGLGAYYVRALLVPGWSGALARLAEFILGLSALIVISELLGLLSLFEEVPLVLACVAPRPRRRLVGSRARRAQDQAHESPAVKPSPLMTAVAVFAAAVVVIHWAEAIAGVARRRHVLPGHHLVPHVVLGTVRADRRGRAPPLHRPAEAHRLVLPPELRAPPLGRDRRDRQRLALAAGQPRLAGALAARGLVHRPPLRGRRGDGARRGGGPRLRDAGRLPGGQRTQRRRRPLLPLSDDRLPGQRRGDARAAPESPPGA